MASSRQPLRSWTSHLSAASCSAGTRGFIRTYLVLQGMMLSRLKWANGHDAGGSTSVGKQRRRELQVAQSVRRKDTWFGMTVKVEAKISEEYGIGRLFAVPGRLRQRRGLARGLLRHRRFEKRRLDAGQRWDTRPEYAVLS